MPHLKFSHISNYFEIILRWPWSDRKVQYGAAMHKQTISSTSFKKAEVKNIKLS